MTHLLLSHQNAILYTAQTSPLELCPLGILADFYENVSWKTTEQKLCFVLILILLPVVTVRDAKHTNFVEFRNFKIVYRRYEIILENRSMLNRNSNVRYAGLYFCICVDVSDNNLYYLEVKKAKKNFYESAIFRPSTTLWRC